jgi:hypothetical protein
MAARRRGARRKGGALDLMGYALAGARARLQELARETGELFRHFPQLRTESPSPWGMMTPTTPRRRGSRSQVRAVGPPTGVTQVSAAPRRRRRKLSAEARAKISTAQKRRWAAQRKKAR